jgi:hypothetical protein
MGKNLTGDQISDILLKFLSFNSLSEFVLNYLKQIKSSQSSFKKVDSKNLSLTA